MNTEIRRKIQPGYANFRIISILLIFKPVTQEEITKEVVWELSPGHSNIYMEWK